MNVFISNGDLINDRIIMLAAAIVDWPNSLTYQSFDNFNKICEMKHNLSSAFSHSDFSNEVLIKNGFFHEVADRIYLNGSNSKFEASFIALFASAFTGNFPTKKLRLFKDECGIVFTEREVIRAYGLIKGVHKDSFDDEVMNFLKRKKYLKEVSVEDVDLYSLKVAGNILEYVVAKAIKNNKGIFQSISENLYSFQG